MKRNATKKGIAAVICALAVMLLAGAYAAMMLFAYLQSRMEMGTAAVLLLVFALVYLGVMAGVLLALRLRLKELKGGEEEDAKKY